MIKKKEGGKYSMKQLEKDIQTALNWYKYLPQHLMKADDVEAHHRLEKYIKKQEKTE